MQSINPISPLFIFLCRFFCSSNWLAVKDSSKSQPFYNVSFDIETFYLFCLMEEFIILMLVVVSMRRKMEGKKEKKFIVIIIFFFGVNLKSTCVDKLIPFLLVFSIGLFLGLLLVECKWIVECWRCRELLG